MKNTVFYKTSLCLALCIFSGVVFCQIKAQQTQISQTKLPMLVLDKTNSQIHFEFQQMGVRSQGIFKNFQLELSFDPKQLKNSQASIYFDLQQIDGGTPEANDILKSPEWFDTKNFPQADFKSTEIRALSLGNYEALGRLRIKNITKNISLQFKAEQNNLSHWVLSGKMPISRTAFGLGQGVWKDTSVLSDIVYVSFRLVLKKNK